MLELSKICAITKVEELPTGLAIAWGRSTAEVEDSDHEIASFPETADAYRRWSDSSLSVTSKSGAAPSLGNVRLMHGLQIAGKVVKMSFDTVRKEIWMGVEAADQATSDLMRRGLVTGFSHAGAYGRRWHKECGTDISAGNYCPKCRKNVAVHYFPDPVTEVSLVDRPAMPTATFAYVKADGTQVLRKFEKSGEVSMTPQQHLENVAKCHANAASAHRELAAAHKAKMDFAVARAHEKLAAAHVSLSSTCSAMADLAGTASAQTEGLARAAKVLDDFIFQPFADMARRTEALAKAPLPYRDSQDEVAKNFSEL